MKKIIILALLALSNKALSEKTMNDISLAQFGDFSKNWELITVRFRTDSNEMRFIYANETAAEALKKNSTNYPNGAVFAKIGVATLEDPVFPSSSVPSGARRIQIMLRDNNKYKETNGWGYALFDKDGNTFPGDVHTATVACYACHKIVASRGDVFAQPIGKIFEDESLATTWNLENKFIDYKTKDLPQKIKKEIDPSLKAVRLLQGPLSENLFFGTLDEIKPLLIRELIKTKLPAILISKDKKSFSLVKKDNNSKCENGALAIISVHTVNHNDSDVLEKKLCHNLK